jgi:hypothetical protein
MPPIADRDVTLLRRLDVVLQAATQRHGAVAQLDAGCRKLLEAGLRLDHLRTVSEATERDDPVNPMVRFTGIDGRPSAKSAPPVSALYDSPALITSPKPTRMPSGPRSSSTRSARPIRLRALHLHVRWADAPCGRKSSQYGARCVKLNASEPATRRPGRSGQHHFEGLRS